MPPNADANARTACGNKRIGKYEAYFILCLTPAGLKQKVHRALSEVLKKTWDALQTIIINKDTSLLIIAERSGFQKSSSNSVNTDSRFLNIEKILNEISNMVKNHQINAINDPNNAKM